MLDRDCTTAAVWPQMAGTYKWTKPPLCEFPAAGVRGSGFGTRDSGKARCQATGYAGGFARCSRISSRLPFTEATPNFFS